MKVPASAAGKTGTCPTCATRLVVPLLLAPTPADTVLTAAPPPANPPVTALAVVPSAPEFGEPEIGSPGKWVPVRARVDAGLRRSWPVVRRLFRVYVGPAALRAATSEAAFTKLCVLVHARLPPLVRLGVPEEAFVKFVLGQRDRLVGDVAEDASADENPLVEA